MTEAPGSVTGTTATFKGELNPGAGTEEASYRFAYSAGVGAACSESGLTAPKESPFPHATGNHKKVSLAVTGLEGSTSYSVCLVAINAIEEATQGTQQTFTTPAADPVVVAQRTQEGSITPFDAALEAEINPENLVGAYNFEYSTSNTLAGAKSFGESAIPRSSEVQGTGPVDIGGGLTPGTVYYYRVVVTNSTGTTRGPIEEFETLALQAPVISEVPAASVEHAAASLSVLIDPEFQETSGKFEYGPTEGYGSELAFGPFGGTSSGTPEFIGVGLEGLTANTLYHYRVTAENGTGTTESPDETFVTLPNTPTATTGQATGITTSSATITGAVNPEDTGQPAQDATTYLFQYGRTASYGSQTPSTPGEAGEGETPKPEQTTLQGLEPGATYHYRIVAANNHTGTPQPSYGEDETFTTLATPPTLTAVTPTGVSQSAATIAASLQTAGLPTRYALSLATTPTALQPVASGNTSTPSQLFLTATSLTPGTMYYYSLSATSSNGSTQASGQFVTLPAPSGPAQSTLPALVPSLSIAELDSKEAKELKAIHTQPVPTTAEKLARALKRCRKDHGKRTRIACERQAHKRFPRHKNHK